MSGVDGTFPSGTTRRTYAGLAAIELGDGPTVLLVPGLTGSKEDFTLLLPHLAAAGLRAVAIDLRGQFESPGVEDPAAYGIEALGRDVLAVISETGAVHLVGHSFGGLVCRSAVLAVPDAVRDLVLLSSGPGALGGFRAEVLDLMKPILAEGGVRAVAEAAAALAAADPSRPPQPQPVRDFQFRRHLGNHPVGLLAMTDAALTAPDLVDELAASGVRTLVARGAGDDAWPAEANEQMAARLGAPYDVIPDAEHSPAAENPAATAEVLLRFWG